MIRRSTADQSELTLHTKKDLVSFVIVISLPFVLHVLYIVYLFVRNKCTLYLVFIKLLVLFLVPYSKTLSS